MWKLVSSQTIFVVIIDFAKGVTKGIDVKEGHQKLSDIWKAAYLNFFNGLRVDFNVMLINNMVNHLN